MLSGRKVPPPTDIVPGYAEGQRQVLSPPPLVSAVPNWLSQQLFDHAGKRVDRDGIDRTISREWLVEFEGARVGEVNKGFASLVAVAGLGPEVTPHTLRHTAATWLMQSGADLWDAAGFLGMSVATLERVYGHHHPDHQRTAVENLGRRGR